MSSAFLYQIFQKLGFTDKTNLKWIHAQDKHFKAGFVSGFLYTDGHSEWNNSSRSLSVRLSNSCYPCLQEVQLVFQELGIFSRINLSRPAGWTTMPDSNRQPKQYKTQSSYRLIIGGQQNCFNLLDICRLHEKDVNRIQSVKNSLYRKTRQNTFSRVVSVEWASNEDVYCLQEDNRRTLIAEGMTARRCVEIGLYPQTVDGRSGVQFCNLCEINGKWCDTEEKFFEACRAAAIIGTLQAGYTNFRYLSPESTEITAKEALLGVSITGVMDNPDILLNPESQRKGAEVCKKINKQTAEKIGINAAARITCTKPAGSTSCVLQTSSGIHPHHARRYLRRVQANHLEFPLQYFKSINPEAVEKSVWSANGTDDVISFVCEVPKGAILKNDLGAVDLLKKVKSSQINWVLNGENKDKCVTKDIHHNISNTINVRPEEWEAVTKYIYDNREFFTGVSLLSSSGDLDYPQAPFTTVLTPEELVREYGEGSILASGLVVDGLYAFSGNLWDACDKALKDMGIASETEPQPPSKPRRRDYSTEKAFSVALSTFASKLNAFYEQMGEYKQNELKIDWIRRAKQFADRYFAGDLRRATYCLKHVSLWHTWLTLKRTYKDVDWASAVEETETHVDANTLGAQACSGGSCELR